MAAKNCTYYCREDDLFGCLLRVEAMQYMQEMAKYISTFLLLDERLDENGQAVK